ncbi:MAG: molybdate ABC transporter permease subunit, partial [Acidimicrobiales bacterium]
MAALAAAVPPSPLPPGRAAPSGGPARPPARPLRWLGGVALLYLTVPIVAFAVRLAATGQRGFHDPGIFEALGVSVECATISAALIATFGVPLAFVLARSRSRLGSVVGVVVQLPLAVPPVMGGILLVYLVGPYTFLGRLFGGHLTDSLAGIVLAQTFVAAPFLVVAARSAFASIDPGLTDVAATLGHGEVGRFLRVAVPVAAPGIWAGLALSWLRAFGEYGATVVLAYHPTSLPVDTFTEFSAGGLPGTMAPTALALGVAVVAVT